MASDKGLFESGSAPLADRMRPASLEEMAGQDSVVGPSSPLHKAIRRDDLGSIVALYEGRGLGKVELGDGPERYFAAALRADLEARQGVQRAAIIAR